MRAKSMLVALSVSAAAVLAGCATEGEVLSLESMKNYVPYNPEYSRARNLWRAFRKRDADIKDTDPPPQTDKGNSLVGAAAEGLAFGALLDGVQHAFPSGPYESFGSLAAPNILLNVFLAATRPDDVRSYPQFFGYMPSSDAPTDQEAVHKLVTQIGAIIRAEYEREGFEVVEGTNPEKNAERVRLWLHKPEVGCRILDDRSTLARPGDSTPQANCMIVAWSYTSLDNRHYPRLEDGFQAPLSWMDLDYTSARRIERVSFGYSFSQSAAGGPTVNHHTIFPVAAMRRIAKRLPKGIYMYNPGFGIGRPVVYEKGRELYFVKPDALRQKGSVRK